VEKPATDHAGKIMHITSPLKTFTLTGMLMFSLALLPAQADPLKDYTAVYKVEKYNTDVGRATYQLEQEDNKAHFFLRTELTGFIALFRKDRVIEDSWLLNKNGELQLQRYSYQQEGSKRNRNTQISIQWNSESNTGIASGDHAGKSVSFDVGNRVRDALSFQLSLMQDATEETTPLDYAVLNKDELKHYVFKRAGPDTLTINNHEIDTIIVERQQEDRITRLWLATAYQYVPVQIEVIEDDDTDTRMQIDALTLDGKRVL
jgi:hypothetical protein